MRVSSDQWHLVAKHLNVRDLCRLMQVSKDWFHLWIADRAWAHQRQRICATFPTLESVFGFSCEIVDVSEHTCKRTEKSNSNKKRKKAWVTPRKGIWYTFKKWFMMGTHMKGIKELCKREETYPIVMSVILFNLPHHELITKTVIRSLGSSSDVPLRGVYFKYAIEVYWGSKRYQCYIQNMISDFQHRSFALDEQHLYFPYQLFGISIDEMSRWKSFLFETVSTKDRWTEEFEKMVKE